MKKIRSKIILTIAVLVMLFSAALLHRTHVLMASHVDEMLHRKLELAMHFDLAIRQYVYDEIVPRMFSILPEDDFIPEIMSSSFVARQVFERVQSEVPDLVIKFSSPNPRNPINLAGPEELGMIAYFNEHPERKLWSGSINMNENEYVALFHAMRMEENCLKCHGHPADAPKKLVERYGPEASFHLPLGQVVGMETLMTSSEDLKSIIAKATFSHFSVVFVGIILLFSAIIMVLRFSVTDRRIARIALQQSEAKYRLIFENTPIGIFHYNEKGVVSACNRYFADIIGVPMDDLVGLDMYMQLRDSRVLGALTESLAGRRGSFTGEYISVLSGRMTYANAVFVPFTDINGEIKGGIGVVEDIQERIIAEQELQKSRNQLRNLSQHLLSAREEEQKRIARDIHDELGQTLSAVKMEISWLKNRMPPDLVPAQAKAEAALELIDGAIDSVRRIISELRPALLTELGLAAAMQWQMEKFAELSGIDCHINIASEEIDIDEDRATTIFRIFSEAVNNAVKHSGASEIHVHLEHNAETGDIELTVSDNGAGITREDMRRDNAYGIMGIKERVALYNGNMELSGRPGKGTLLRVRIPSGQRQ
jgi:PAS domain S-box-containing protein